jgi:hypothetical protein
MNRVAADLPARAGSSRRAEGPVHGVRDFPTHSPRRTRAAGDGARPSHVPLDVVGQGIEHRVHVAGPERLVVRPRREWLPALATSGDSGCGPVGCRRPRCGADEPVRGARPAVRSSDASFCTRPLALRGSRRTRRLARRVRARARRRHGDRSGRPRGTDPSAVSDHAGADHL